MRLLTSVNIITYIYIYIARSTYATEITDVYDICCCYDKNAAHISIAPVHATCPVHLTLLHIVATIYGANAARTLTF